MDRILLIGLAGLLGTLARYGVDAWFSRRFGQAFPLGTLTLNLLGCFLIGVLFQLLHERFLLSPALRSALVIGFLGALTTFSSFGLQTFSLLREGHLMLALLYVSLSNLMGVLLVWVGYSLARLW